MVALGFDGHSRALCQRRLSPRRSDGKIRAILEAVGWRDRAAAEAATRAYVKAARVAALRQLGPG